ncbi:MAG: GGDEF domain-containing protein [Rhizobiaceae bacterium]|nr:GGDEF domain-containing protein [Rhizobiaceae bacterium]MCV0407694.1 GGDEF domain-containing protein [Rhizobiaceae bacterium]
MSRQGWWQLARWTVLGTLGCIAISVAYNAIVFWNYPSAAFRQGLLSAIVLPIVLAGPLFFYLTLKLRELAIANHKLTVLASTDSLTGVLNRGAFAARVGALLERPAGASAASAGAFLLIDADHFKAINDHHGHEHGDQALRLIAAAIRTTVRKNDLVGRLGGEEFGVFLPGATYANAMAVAERIRTQIEQTPFRPDDRLSRLSVSIGGASFQGGRGFDELFRIADERLYVAKHAGRNRVSMAQMLETVSTRPTPSAALH